MRIFWLEVKKLFNWKILLFIAVFSAMYYYAYISLLCFQYSFGESGATDVAVSETLLKEYGTTMDAAERQDFEQTGYQKFAAPVNSWIAADPGCQKAGVRTIDELNALSEKKETNPLYRTLFEKMLHSDGGVSEEDFFLYQSAVQVVERFHDMQKTADNVILPPAIHNETGDVSVFPYVLQTNWNNLAGRFAILLLITMALLVTPAMVRERRSGVRALAYTCRAGRGLFRTQFAASGAAALLAFLAQAAALALCCFVFGPHRPDFDFLACDVSGWDLYPLWYSLTFGQLLGAYFCAAFLLAAACAFLSFGVSSFCKNYVTAIAVQIPLLVLEIWLCSSLFFRENWYMTLGSVRFGSDYLCAAFAAVMLAGCLLLAHREQKRDVPA